MEFLAQPFVQQFNLLLHIASVCIGFGGAMVTDILFFHFLRDFFISHRERNIMRLLATIVLSAMLVIILSGFLLYFADPMTYNDNPRFWLKMVAVLVACINGLAMHLYLTPHLLKLSFAMMHSHGLDLASIQSIRRMTRMAFAMGAVSAISWWTALLTAMFKAFIPFSLSPLLVAYGAVLLIGIVTSQVIEKRYFEGGRAFAQGSRRWRTVE